MAARPGRFPGLRLVALACCPATPLPTDSSWGAGPTQLPAAVASLHVRSAQDMLVPAADSEAMQAATLIRVGGRNPNACRRAHPDALQVAAFEPTLAEVYMHAKGHAMPCAQRDVDTYVAFLTRMQRPAAAAATTSSASSFAASAASAASATFPASSSAAASVSSSAAASNATSGQAPWQGEPGGRAGRGRGCRLALPPGLAALPGKGARPATALQPAAPPQQPATPARAAPAPAPLAAARPASLATVEAWAAEVAALEAIYGDDLSHEEGGTDATGLEAAAGAAAAKVAAAGAAGGLALEQVALERAGLERAELERVCVRLALLCLLYYGSTPILTRCACASRCFSTAAASRRGGSRRATCAWALHYRPRIRTAAARRGCSCCTRCKSRSCLGRARRRCGLPPAS